MQSCLSLTPKVFFSVSKNDAAGTRVYDHSSKYILKYFYSNADKFSELNYSNLLKRL